MNNRLFKIVNTKTCEPYYVIRPTHIAYILDVNTSMVYSIVKNKGYKHWEVTEIDGTNIPYGKIWKTK